jgi:hypothetical protein
VGEDRTPTRRRRYTVLEAAGVLGVTVEAVRGRIKRGTLAHEKGEDGTVYVLLNTDQAQPVGDQTANQTLLVVRLENEVQFLREELARKDAILLNMAEAVKAISPPAQEETSPEPRESPVTATDATEGGEPPSTEEHLQRRSWWRRIFGGGRP